MTQWHERSREERALLNPAFCSILLWFAARGYGSVKQGALSFEEAFLILPMVLHRTTREALARDTRTSLAFLILPMVLHRTTREALARDTRTSLAVWINSNPLAQGRIATRARLLVTFTKEGMVFGGAHGLTRINEGWLHANEDWRQPIHRSLRDSSEEVRLCARRAEFVGKWFARTGSASTVFALMGVRP